MTKWSQSAAKLLSIAELKHAIQTRETTGIFHHFMDEDSAETNQDQTGVATDQKLLSRVLILANSAAGGRLGDRGPSSSGSLFTL